MAADSCQFDGYECFRNHCCYSRFYSDFRCLRFVVVANGWFTPRLVKVASNRLKAVRKVVFRG